MKSGYESIEHTADKAIRAWGQDYEDLLNQAAVGMIAQMVESESVCATDRRTVTAEADSREILLHHLLKELLYLVEDDGLVPLDVVSVQSDGARARMEVSTVPMKVAKQHMSGVLKAVTYHDLNIQERDGGLVVEITFDT